MDFSEKKALYKKRAELKRQEEELKRQTEILQDKHEAVETAQAALKAKNIAVESAEEAKRNQEIADAKREAVMQSLECASRIQKNLLPYKSVFEEAFGDHEVLWYPRDLVSGDIYWIKNFDEGTVLCVCDCTGHGTPGALLTMIVVSSFGMIVNEKTYRSTAKIMSELDIYLSRTLHDHKKEATQGMTDIKEGCDLAVLYIPKKGDITYSSANFPVFVCDGESVERKKGQRIFMGEGELVSEADVQVVTLPKKAGSKYYISSDGMFDQKGGPKGHPYGYKKFEELIKEYHDKPLQTICDIVWEDFVKYQGEHPRKDDFELVCFSPKSEECGQ